MAKVSQPGVYLGVRTCEVFLCFVSIMFVLSVVLTSLFSFLFATSLVNVTGWVYLGVKTCEVFLCFVTIMFVLSFVLTSLFSLFYVTREGDRFLHRG